MLLLIPFGVVVNGAKRWVRIFGFQLMPVEFLKISVIMICAYLVHRYARYLNTVRLCIVIWIVVGIPVILTYKISDDLSSAIVLLGIGFIVTFICTTKWLLHLGVVLLGGTVVGVYVWKIAVNLPTSEELAELPFRISRIAAFLKTEMYSNEYSFQSLNAKYAIGSGGLLGRGIGKSLQKYLLPECHTDFCFTIVCEELGIFGAACLIFLYCSKFDLRSLKIIGGVLIYDRME